MYLFLKDTDTRLSYTSEYAIYTIEGIGISREVDGQVHYIQSATTQKKYTRQGQY